MELQKTLKIFFIAAMVLKKTKEIQSHFSLHLMGMKTKQKLLKTHFRSCDEYENGCKQNSRSFNFVFRDCDR